MILVVASDIKFLSILEKEVLDSSDSGVFIASTQKSALEMALIKNPELIFIESRAQSFSSRSLIDNLRQSSCISPIILLTYGESEEIIDSLRQGADDFIKLPIVVTEAREVLQRVRKVSRARIDQEKNQKKLILDEAVRITLTTLSHYLNNYLTALDGDLTLLHEALQNQEPASRQLDILNQSRRDAVFIKKVIEVLVNTKSIKLVDYDNSDMMIDITIPLANELNRILNGGQTDL